MDMVISGTNHEDVAEPDAMASGVAGTGQEPRNCAGPATCGSGKTSKRRDCIVIGLGILSPRREEGISLPEIPAPSPATLAGKEGSTDLIFALYERDERIAERLERKISRLEKRLDQIEEKGRS